MQGEKLNLNELLTLPAGAGKPERSAGFLVPLAGLVMHLTNCIPVYRNSANYQEKQPIHVWIYTIPPVVALGNFGPQNTRQLHQCDLPENLDTKTPLCRILDKNVNRHWDLYLHF